MPDYKTFFEKLAQDRNISVEEMLSIIVARIETGINDPDPVRRAQYTHGRRFSNVVPN